MSQKIGTMTFCADGTFFAFFGVSSPLPDHCFDPCFVSVVNPGLVYRKMFLGLDS